MSIKPRVQVPLLLILLFSLGIFGCGGKDGDSKDVGGGDQTDGPIERKANLELLGDYGPPLDGIVEIAPPKQWSAPPRSAEYLMQFSGAVAANNPLPRIRITAESSTFESKNLTNENLTAFVAHVKADLKETGKDASVKEKPVAMIIGGRPCVRYVAAGALRLGPTRLSTESQWLVTVVNGKRFNVELQVTKGLIPDSLDESYAVFAGMRFIGDTGESTDAPKPQPDESDEPVDSDKADESKQD